MSPRNRSFWTDFKTFFLRGLGILLPSIVTLGLLIWAFTFLRDRVAAPMNAGVRQVVLWSAPSLVGDETLPEWFAVTEEQVRERQAERQRQGLSRMSDDATRSAIRAEALAEYWRARWYLEGIGFAVAVVLIYLAGVLLGGIIGRRVYVRVERFFVRLPIIKQVYPNVKQITDFMIGGGASKHLPEGRVVLVEYPRVGIWTVGLLTGRTMRSIQSIAGTDCRTVFIPSSPTPFTGYTITVRKEEVHELDLTLDEAIRFVVSGGVLVPDRESLDPIGERQEGGGSGDEDEGGPGRRRLAAGA